MDFTLTIAEGKGAGQRLTYSGERVTIGRDAKSDLVLPDAGVSRNHARIELRHGAWVLVDGGSANGTELNGLPVGPPQQLKAGDRIGVGRVVFRFGALGSPAWPQGEDPGAVLRRRSIVAGVGAGLLALLGLVALRGQAQRPAVACPETAQTGTGQTFGHGAVDVECGDRAVFGFEVPERTRALLHYRAEGELALRLNGKLVGRASSGAQALELPVQAGRALVAFAHQGAEQKAWSVGEVRVELIESAPGDLGGAGAAYERGRRKLEERRIAPRNLYDAWTAFVETRQKLEGLEEKPPFQAELNQLIQECERDLARECGRLLFAAARFERYGQEESAQRTYRKVLLHFPGDDPSGCRKKARGNLVSEVARQ